MLGYNLNNAELSRDDAVSVMITPLVRVAQISTAHLLLRQEDSVFSSNIDCLPNMAETLNDKPSFKKPFKNQRCIAPALGFYEWKKEGNSKTPHFIHREDGNLLALAGLYDNWNDELYSYTIITTTPNQVMEPIHDRMPVILEEDQFNLWLEGDVDPVEVLLKPF